MIDFHILTHPTQGRDHTAIKSDLEGAGFNVHVLKGTKGNIGRGRSKGFALGDSEFVSFVDDDDQVVIEGVKAAHQMLIDNPELDAVCTLEEVVKEDGTTRVTAFRRIKEGDLFNIRNCLGIHHVVVARRSAVEPYLKRLAKWNKPAELALWASMVRDGAKIALCREVGYRWHIHSGCSYNDPEAVPLSLDCVNTIRKAQNLKPVKT